MNRPTIHRLIFVRGMRAFCDGYVSLVLPLYLLACGKTTFEIGVIATATLFGSGAMTLLVGMHATRLPYKTLLLIAGAIMMLTGLGFAYVQSFWLLLPIAIIGTLNPSTGDVSVFIPLEHALLSHSADNEQRTAVFARFGMVGTLSAAFGSLAAGLPQWLAHLLNIDFKFALQMMFLLYSIVGLIITLVYLGLPKESFAPSDQPTTGRLERSKKNVYTLAGLFAIDAFGGGLLVQSMVALWLFQKFQLPVTTAGTIFFCMGFLSAFSYPVASWIAKRIGLINTMVFTHLPASIALILIPFMPNLTWVVVLLMIRGALSQMDVPTRSSYVMAIVPPEERAAAASVTLVPRSLAAAAGPVVAGYLFGLSPFGWPFVVGGGLKATYDFLLLAMFKAVKPPEEVKS